MTVMNNCDLVDLILNHLKENKDVCTFSLLNKTCKDQSKSKRRSLAFKTLKGLRRRFFDELKKESRDCFEEVPGIWRKEQLEIDIHEYADFHEFLESQKGETVSKILKDTWIRIERFKSLCPKKIKRMEDNYPEWKYIPIFRTEYKSTLAELNNHCDKIFRTNMFLGDFNIRSIMIKHSYEAYRELRKCFVYCVHMDDILNSYDLYRLNA